MKQPASATTNDLAIASLVLGILSLTGMGPLTGIPAIITGWLGLKKPGGRGMAIAGLVTGGISLILTMLVIFFFILLFILGLVFGSSPEPTPQPYEDGMAPSFDTRRT